ncbi:glycosyltransferase family 2 protein [Patescibacteria group bacterium]|jgi:GT2 family glycosyltransferase|nr:glycosyltransferase family 2 protein [Patescibacteria group bacterium]
MAAVTVVYVNYNMRQDILASLTTLFKDIPLASHEVTVVVVDNSENRDGVREAVAELFPSVRYLDAGGNVGFGAGNNAAFRAYPANYYLAINPDTLIPDGANVINNLVRYMEEHPEAGVIGPRLLNPDGSTQQSSFRFNLQSMLIKPIRHLKAHARIPALKRAADALLMKDFDRTYTRPVDWILGAALFIRHEAVAQLGFFDERYFLYIEDCDLCHSVWHSGREVHYVHDIVIHHKHERGSSKVSGALRGLLKNKLARLHIRSWLQYLWKWLGNHRSYDKA